MARKKGSPCLLYTSPVAILLITIGLGAGFQQQGQAEGGVEGVLRGFGQVFVDDEQAAGAEGLADALDDVAIFFGAVVVRD